MDTYNIYFDLKEGIKESDVFHLATEFAKALKKEGVIDEFKLNTIEDKGNFPEIPDLHMAVYFKSAAHMDDGFKIVQSKYLNEHPHSELMASVSNFKVSFGQRHHA